MPEFDPAWTGVALTFIGAAVGWAWKIASYLSSIATEVKSFGTFREKTEEHHTAQHKINHEHGIRLTKVEATVERHHDEIHELKHRERGDG